MPHRRPRPRPGRRTRWSVPARAWLVALIVTASLVTPVAADDPSSSPDPSLSASASVEASPSATPEATSAAPSPTETAGPATSPSPSPSPPPPSAKPTPPTSIVLAADPLSVAMSQSGVSYDASTNRARVRVTVTPTGAELPWRYVVAVRGTAVASGTSSAASVAVLVTNNCSITTQSVTGSVTGALDRTAGAAATLDRSLCPPPRTTLMRGTTSWPARR